MPTLADILAGIDSVVTPTKRRLSDLMRNPVAYTQQAFGNVGDGILRFNQNAVMAQEGADLRRQGSVMGDLPQYTNAQREVVSGLMNVMPVGVARKIRPSTDDPYEVMDATFNYGKVGGNKMMPINELIGGVRFDAKETARVKALADKIGGESGYISRLLVDDAGNVLEGQHRLEALRLLGDKQVPVTVIHDLSRGKDMRAVEAAISSTRPMRAEHVEQIAKHALEMHADAGSAAAALEKYKLPNQYKAQFEAALRALDAK